MTRFSGKQFVGDLLDFVSGPFRSRIQAGPLTEDVEFLLPGQGGTFAIAENTQPLDSNLTAIADLATTGLIERTGVGTAETRPINTLGQTLINTDAAGARSALSLGAMATQDSSSVSITNGTINADTLSSGLWKRVEIGNENTTATFTHFVLLLHPAYDGATLSPYNIANGDIFISRGSQAALSIATQIKVFSQSVYSDNGGYLEVLHFGQGATNNYRFNLCTCQYNGILWMGIQCTGVTSPYSTNNGWSFEGLHNAQGDPNALKKVGYYRSASGGIVLNSEINNSITPFVPTFNRRYLSDAIIFGDKGQTDSIQIKQNAIQFGDTGGRLSGAESILTNIASPGASWSFSWARALVGDIIEITPTDGSSLAVRGRCQTAGTVLADTSTIASGKQIQIRVVRTTA